MKKPKRNRANSGTEMLKMLYIAFIKVWICVL
nr:MAG TPA: hypothetical protein [Caudoviricetes sp.]